MDEKGEKKLRHTRLFYMFISLLLVTACSDNETTQEKKEGKEEAQEVIQQEEPRVVEYPKAATVPEEIMGQPIGEKTQTQEDLETLMTEFELEGLEPEQIYDGLVHWFGFDYQGVYGDLRDFEPDFGELDITKAQEEKVKNIAIHLDSSGSMAGHVSGGEKMKLAKDALKKYASGLPEDSILSLRVYGHKGSGSDSDKSLSCKSTEVMYPASTYNEEAFIASLGKFKPSGWTPLAASIQSAYDDLKKTASANTENILFVVSDGIETCGGNPVEEAKKLAESDLSIKVNIIGFNVDDEGQSQLKATAEAGNGEYYTVNSNIDFTNTINQLLEDAAKSTQKNFEKAGLSMKVNFRLVEIGTEIRGLGSNFQKVLEQERQRIADALYELYKQDKVTEEDNTTIQNLITERYESLSTLKNSLLERANEKKEKKHQELLTAISNS